MKILFAAAFLAFALVYPFEFAQAGHPHPCSKTLNTYEMLQEKYSEARIGVGYLATDPKEVLLIEFWASPGRDTWSVILTDTRKGFSCMILNGQDLDLGDDVQPKPAGQPANL